MQVVSRRLAGAERSLCRVRATQGVPSNAIQRRLEESETIRLRLRSYSPRLPEALQIQQPSPELSLPFSLFPRTGMDDELRDREERARESELERMRSRTCDSVQELAPLRSKEPEENRASRSQDSEELRGPLSPAISLGPPGPDSDLDGSSV